MGNGNGEEMANINAHIVLYNKNYCVAECNSLTYSVQFRVIVLRSTIYANEVVATERCRFGCCLDVW